MGLPTEYVNIHQYHTSTFQDKLGSVAHESVLPHLPHLQTRKLLATVVKLDKSHHCHRSMAASSSVVKLYVAMAAIETKCLRSRYAGSWLIQKQSPGTRVTRRETKLMITLCFLATGEVENIDSVIFFLHLLHCYGTPF